MKRKILALVCAMTMVLGMSLTVCAAGSASASDIAQPGKPSAGASDIVNNVSAPAPSAPADVLVSSSENANGQVLTTETLGYFFETTTVSGVQGATLKAVSAETAKAVIAQARAIAGESTFIATIVDLEVPAGTGAATFTLGCPNVWKGQNVTILHQKSDGTFESIKPSSVEDNKVTFTLSSYSPVAIVINTGAKAPKTGDIILMIMAMTGFFGLGAGACAKKAKEN